MLSKTPAQITIWTDKGRDDQAADVGLVADADGSLRVMVDAPSAAPSYVILRWNDALPEGARILGDHWERGYGDLEWRGAVAERTLPWYALIHDPARGDTRGIGVGTGASSLASWRVDETGITLVLDIRCGGSGVQLEGRRLEAATIRELTSRSGESAFAFARRFCQALCPSPRLPALPVYGGNDWYSRYGRISAETVRLDSALIHELSPSGNNAPSYVIDAGWYPKDNHDGAIYDRGNERFPDMPGLAEWIHGHGVRPGIWIRPLLVADDVPREWRFSPQYPLAKTPGVFLDPSIPEVLARVREDIARLTHWGYRLIKRDFTTWDILGRWGFEMLPQVTTPGWAFADRSRTTAEIVRNLYVNIREAAGDAYLIGCNTIGHLGAGLFELQRTGDDTSGHKWERTRKMGPNTVGFRIPQHGTFFDSDPDCIGLRTDIPWEQNKQWLDLVARSGMALFVSAHPDAVGPEQRAALHEAFARAAVPNAPGEPLDWMETTCPRHWKFGEETRTYDWHPFPGNAFVCPP